jgi:opacity protein-like surface antigen
MKKLLLVLVIILAMSSVAMAAPVTNLEKGESAVGYLYWNPNVDAFGGDFGNASASGFYVETAVSDKVIIGLETIKGDKSKTISGIKAKVDTRFTDLTIQYKLDNNIRLIAGNRNYDTDFAAAGVGSYSNSSDKFFYGVSASTSLGDKATAYAAVTHSSIATEWQIGANQNITKNLDLNINYRYYDQDDDLTLKGIGAGLIYKF